MLWLLENMSYFRLDSHAFYCHFICLLWYYADVLYPFRCSTVRVLRVRKQWEMEKLAKNNKHFTVMTGSLPAWRSSWRVKSNPSQKVNRKRTKGAWVGWQVGCHLDDAYHLPQPHDWRVALPWLPSEVLSPKTSPTYHDSTNALPLFSPFLIHDLKHP